MSLFVMRGLIYPLLYLLVMLLGMYGVNSTFVGGYMYFCSREGQGKVEHRTHLGVDRRDGNSPCYGTCSLVYVICYIIYFWYGSLVGGRLSGTRYINTSILGASSGFAARNISRI